MSTREDQDLARTWADFYRRRGYNPLPSREDAKRPLVRFGQWWDTPAPADLWDHHPTSNVQLMTGRTWRLLVIDLDGPAARDEWRRWGAAPRTWITHSGGDGQHWWFRLPERLATPLPKEFLWRGDGEHQAIERLCDHSLIMVPPSIHPRTGQRYRFVAGHSPKQLPLPAGCPSWVLRRAPVVPARVLLTHGNPGNPSRASTPRPTIEIRDKVRLAQSWGLRLAGPPRASGWVPCHAFDREDHHASAAIHQESGYYVDHGSGLRLRFLELGVELGAYRDVSDALRQLKGSA